MRTVILWQQPELERETRSKRADDQETLVLKNDPAPVPAVLIEDIAENAALLEGEVIPRPSELRLHVKRNDR